MPATDEFKLSHIELADSVHQLRKHIPAAKLVAPDKFVDVRWEHLSLRSVVPLLLTFGPLPGIFYILCVDGIIHTMHEVVLVNHNTVFVHRVVHFCNVVARRPAIAL